MESKILDCAQGIFDNIESIDISQQPKTLGEISNIMGQLIWLHEHSIDSRASRCLTDDLANLLVTMSSDEIQSTHVLVYGHRYKQTDVIPF